ncbi:spermatogenesis-associated protein 4-like isoform X2 [Littorina saxatilis]|uniref:spermatogenesis-associated protein 4-like isoform X2 n=1 Tax=Littorina saxatilis TaxID=31220 RepID=UPI0038B588B8
MSGLPREVTKWVQSLDLAWQVKTPKWDLTNGYLVAEIFSWYFNQEVGLHSYYNCNSLKQKEKNWYLLKSFIKSKHLDIPDDYIEGTIHCKEGASALLLERLYEILTNRKVKKVPPETETDYTDFAYQVKLPMHARSTASKAVKNNLRLTEVLADENQIHTAQKAHKIINDHIDHRRIERLQDPARFNIKPSIGERCVRKPLPTEVVSSEPDDDEDKPSAPNTGGEILGTGREKTSEQHELTTVTPSLMQLQF